MTNIRTVVGEGESLSDNGCGFESTENYYIYSKIVRGLGLGGDEK